MKRVRNFKRLVTTLWYLRPVQIRYQLYYRLRNSISGIIPIRKKLHPEMRGSAQWNQLVHNPKSYSGNLSFMFLNQSHAFEDEIEWDITDHGKLWGYNLNYFDFLNQEEMRSKEGLGLIRSYMEHSQNHIGNDPYPTSIRGINWIKFLSRFDIDEHEIDQYLYNDYRWLCHNLEYHLLGNHLLENGLSLLFAGVYFNNERYLNISHSIILEQLEEQILQDGGHFERSTMYHCIILQRILDCISLLNYNNLDNMPVYLLLQNSAKNMLSWLHAVRYSDGSIPMVNDAVPGMALNTEVLLDYSRKIGIKWNTIPLSTSGYRMIRKNPWELFMDFGDIGPNYIPGHAHSDTFNFEIYYRGRPFIVETGTSTYEPSERRLCERQTAAHNTVRVEEEEQSDVWGNFRVGRRAHIAYIIETKDSLMGRHNGYKHLGVLHDREIHFGSEKIEITDQLISKKNSKIKAEAFFHFHPAIDDLKLIGDKLVYKSNELEISFKGNITNLSLDYYQHASGYNITKKALMLKISFHNHLTTQIKSSSS